MVTHIKTTIDIATPLLEEAKKRARADGTTLRALVEEGLRAVLREDATPGGPPVHVPVTWAPGEPAEPVDWVAEIRRLRDEDLDRHGRAP